MSELNFESFRPEMSAEVIALLARAFVTDPLHVRVFATNQLTKNQVMFRTLLASLQGRKHVVVVDGRIIGFSHWVQSPQCQPSGTDMVKMIPSMLYGLGLASSIRVIRWTSNWAKYDPKEAHSHLGPIGVEPSAQGKGVGRFLMIHYCEELDKNETTGYLDTTSPGNVQFYSRFGFKTINEIPVLGMTNYLMRREAV